MPRQSVGNDHCHIGLSGLFVFDELSIHLSLQLRTRFDSHKIVPQSCPQSLITFCSTSAPRTPLLIDSISSRGNRARKAFSSSISWTSPCSFCEPCSALCFKSSICRRI